MLSQKSATEVKPQQLSLLAEPQKEPEPIKLQDYSKNQHKELKANLASQQASLKKSRGSFRPGCCCI